MMTTDYRNKASKIVLVIVFVFVLFLNIFLLFIHEPWRDEIHAWLMAKNMTIPELIAFSSYEGHPILWHVMLMPFAKLGAPVWTMNVLSTIIVGVSAYLFAFHTKVNNYVKIAILLTAPYIYIYSSISRNYCIVLICTIIISIMYKKRFLHPILFSIPIAVLVFSHALAWGFVAGITITFYIYELLQSLRKKKNYSKKELTGFIIGLLIIAVASLFVVITMRSGRNEGYASFYNYNTCMTIVELSILSFVVILIALFVNRDTMREALVIVITFVFMIVVYTTVYSTVLLQRALLIEVFLLFYIITTYNEKSFNRNIIAVVSFFIPLIGLGSENELLFTIKEDISLNYSSAQQMADYINANLTEEEILCDAGIICQTIVPYTDVKLYDILYQEYIDDSLYHINDYDAIMNTIDIIKNDPKYDGKYLISYYVTEDYDSCLIKVFETDTSICGEDFSLYLINQSGR